MRWLGGRAMNNSSDNSKDLFPSEARQAAQIYLEHKVLPIPVKARSKAPCDKGWQNLRPSIKDLETLFPSDQNRNLGVLLGKPSDGLIDIDLDADEAILTGSIFLPRTEWVLGRKSK